MEKNNNLKIKHNSEMAYLYYNLYFDCLMYNIKRNDLLKINCKDYYLKYLSFKQKETSNEDEMK